MAGADRVGLALRERMPVWLQTRCGLERRSVVALIVVLVGRRGLRRPALLGRADPAGAGAGGGAGGGPSERGAEPRRRREPPPPAGRLRPDGGRRRCGRAEIVVDVSGKVREPGIQRLPAGSRVADALRAAGGVRPGANTDGLNRARFLVDGEQVVVGGSGRRAGARGGGGRGAGAAGRAAAGAAPPAPVGLNTATAEQLDKLPGVGPVLAQHIIDYRTEHGGFRSVDELREVNGIGDRRFADLQNLVRP